MTKLKLKFIPASSWYDEYDRVQCMHITCLLYKLEVIENPVMMGSASQLITKMAEDMLAGHIHIYERD